MYVCMHAFMHVCMCVYIYIYRWIGFWTQRKHCRLFQCFGTSRGRGHSPIRRGYGRFKAGVRRMLQDQHQKDMEQQNGSRASPRMSESSGQWSCRACRKTFKTKGGLGAHIFKVHGRTAASRACVQRTTCAACGYSVLDRGQIVGASP